MAKRIPASRLAVTAARFLSARMGALRWTATAWFPIRRTSCASRFDPMKRTFIIAPAIREIFLTASAREKKPSATRTSRILPPALYCWAAWPSSSSARCAGIRQQNNSSTTMKPIGCCPQPSDRRGWSEKLRTGRNLKLITMTLAHSFFWRKVGRGGPPPPPGGRHRPPRAGGPAPPPPPPRARFRCQGRPGGGGPPRPTCLTGAKVIVICPSLNARNDMKFKTSFQLVVAVSLLTSAFPSAAFADDTSEEARQISVLQSQSSPQDKDAACAWLKRHGTAKSVPALATLLTDEQLSHSARYALESLPGPEAEHALIAALAQTSGLMKAGIVNSLGVRREPAAVAELAKLLADADVQVASASAAALGEIAAPDALKALEDRLDAANGSAQNAVVDGCIRGAHHLLVAGDHAKAFSIYQEIYKRQTKDFFHAAAFRGMVLASDARGVDLIADAIVNGPASIQMEAIQMIHEKELSGAIEAVAKLLPKVLF